VRHDMTCRYLFLGERFARWCVGPTGVMRHTEGCAGCFADNMGCTIAHCYHECMLQGLFLSDSAARLGGVGSGLVNGTACVHVRACRLCGCLRRRRRRRRSSSSSSVRLIRFVPLALALSRGSGTSSTNAFSATSSTARTRSWASAAAPTAAPAAPSPPSRGQRPRCARRLRRRPSRAGKTRSPWLLRPGEGTYGEKPAGCGGGVRPYVRTARVCETLEAAR
jgi:hypothetical protein